MAGYTGYDFYLDGVLLPVTPSSLTIKTPGQSTTFDVINYSEISELKSPGLREISFEFSLPNNPENLPFAKSGAQPPRYYIEKIEQLNHGKRTFQFIINRKTPQGVRLDDTNITVSIWDFQTKEDAEDGNDFKASIVLKEFPKHTTQFITVTNGTTSVKKTTDDNRWATTGVPKTYTIKTGDTLYNIGRTYYNNGNAWKKIAQMNGITDQYNIKVGTVLSMPEYFGVL
ncbi:LysM domain-containing protein [Methanolapillus millepedarum]|uniref:LysM domain-containing protein n=1 Tax=Methanolapillus millepedarum TaxID=3028296 RepID=A0AA96V414_9EURY|nr:hypothetical protein MsAc7_17600 [Methanosarcinaceae archaeon Ac7]